MEQKAEEYASHPCISRIRQRGTVRIVLNGSERVLMGHKVKSGDCYRSCQTKGAPIKDWVMVWARRCQVDEFPKFGWPG